MYDREKKIYKEKGSFTKAEKLSKSHYKLSLRRFVKYCNEIIVVNEIGNFLLPKRKKSKSASGVWFFGGQVLAFTEIKKSVVETLKREAGLTLPYSRFKYLGQIRHWYGGAEIENTPHDALSEVFVVYLIDSEIKKIKLDLTEFEDSPLEEYDEKKIKSIRKLMNRKIILDLWKKHKDLS